MLSGTLGFDSSAHISSVNWIDAMMSCSGLNCVRPFLATVNGVHSPLFSRLSSVFMMEIEVRAKFISVSSVSF